MKRARMGRAQGWDLERAQRERFEFGLEGQRIASVSTRARRYSSRASIQAIVGLGFGIVHGGRVRCRLTPQVPCCVGSASADA